MKLHAAIADYQTDIQIRDEGARVFAEIDGCAYGLIVTGENGSFVVVSDGHVFDCRVEARPESGKPLDVFVGTNHYQVTLSDPKRLRGAASMGTDADGAARIVAPMPGKVVRVMVKVGDQIESGAGVAVVEAMKMQN